MSLVKSTNQSDATRVIGGLRGRRVRVHAVLRGALRADVNVDADDYFVDDDLALARLGGVTKLDRVDSAHVRALGSQLAPHAEPRIALVGENAPPA